MRSIGVQVLSADLVVLPADHAAQAREVRLRLIGAGVIIDERDRMIDALRGVFVITSDINVSDIMTFYPVVNDKTSDMMIFVTGYGATTWQKILNGNNGLRGFSRPNSRNGALAIESWRKS